MNNNLKKQLKVEKNLIDEKIGKKKLNACVQDEMPKAKIRGKKFGLALVSLAVALAIGFGAIAWVTGNGANSQPTDFYLAFDINPSVELVGENGVVTSIKGLNEDGVILAKELKTQIVNLSPLDATTMIVEKAKQLGYINDALPNGAIVVNVASSNSKLEEELATGVTEKADKFLKDNNIAGEVVSNAQFGNEEVKKLAEQYNVTIGRMSMILNAIKKSPELTVEELVGYSPDQINKIIKNYDQTKLDAFEDKLDALEDEYELKLEELEKVAKENLRTAKEALSSLESEIMNAKTEEEFLAAKEKLIAFSKENPDLNMNFDGLNFQNRKNLSKDIQKGIEKAEDALERELDKMEDEFERELDAQKKALKSDDDDDDDHDDDDDEDHDNDDDERDENKPTNSKHDDDDDDDGKSSSAKHDDDDDDDDDDDEKPQTGASENTQTGAEGGENVQTGATKQ